MIVGVFYESFGDGHGNAIPMFMNDKLEIVGLADVTADEMRFIIAWSMKEVPDDVIEVIDVDSAHFLDMFGNMYYPRRDHITPPKLVLALYRGYERLYTQADIWNAVEVAEQKQQKYWRELHREIDGLTDDQKSVIIAAYRAFGNQAKPAALYLNRDRQLVKQVVWNELLEYAWE